MVDWVTNVLKLLRLALTPSAAPTSTNIPTTALTIATARAHLATMLVWCLPLLMNGCDPSEVMRLDLEALLIVVLTHNHPPLVAGIHFTLSLFS